MLGYELNRLDRVGAYDEHSVNNLIRAGELSGTLTEVFENLGQTLKWQDELAAQTKKLLAYPTLVLFVVLGVMIFLLLYLVPQVTSLLKTMGLTLPIQTRILIGLSNFVADWWFLLVFFPVAATITVGFMARANPRTRYMLDYAMLRLPVIGELVNRFGSLRPDSGLSWKGLFISARPGREVKAVAGGRVVYADWLRGFGNLLILDHGDGYMSLYGNNESLLKAVGAEVRAGDAIALSGSSGGIPESGLYFEIRHQGRAIDPLDWIAR